MIKTTAEITDDFLASEMTLQQFNTEADLRKLPFAIEFANRTNSEGDTVEYLKVGSWVTNFLNTGSNGEGTTYIQTCYDTYTSTQITLKSENGFRWLMDSGGIDDKLVETAGQFIDDLARKQIRVYKYSEIG